MMKFQTAIKASVIALVILMTTGCAAELQNQVDALNAKWTACLQMLPEHNQLLTPQMPAHQKPDKWLQARKARQTRRSMRLIRARHAAMLPMKRLTGCSSAVCPSKHLIIIIEPQHLLRLFFAHRIRLGTAQLPDKPRIL